MHQAEVCRRLAHALVHPPATACILLGNDDLGGGCNLRPVEMIAQTSKRVKGAQEWYFVAEEINPTVSAAGW
jgi:hypothetical protein